MAAFATFGHFIFSLQESFPVEFEGLQETLSFKLRRYGLVRSDIA